MFASQNQKLKLSINYACKEKKKWNEKIKNRGIIKKNLD